MLGFRYLLTGPGRLQWRRRRRVFLARSTPQCPFATPLHRNPPHFTTAGGPRGRVGLVKQRHTADRCMPPFGNTRSAGDRARRPNLIHCISLRERERAGGQLSVRPQDPPSPVPHARPGARCPRLSSRPSAPAGVARGSLGAAALRLGRTKGPEDLRAQRRRRAHLGSVPGGGSAGLRRRGPGGGEVALGRPGPSEALRRWGPAQCRRRGIETRRGRRVGGGTSRQVQVQCPRRRDAPRSSVSDAARVGGGNGGGRLSAGPLRSLRLGLRLRLGRARGGGGGRATARGRPVTGTAGMARRLSGLRGDAVGDGGCGSGGRRAEVRSCHRGHLVALTDKNPPSPRSSQTRRSRPRPRPAWASNRKSYRPLARDSHRICIPEGDLANQLPDPELRLQAPRQNPLVRPDKATPPPAPLIPARVVVAQTARGARRGASCAFFSLIGRAPLPGAGSRSRSVRRAWRSASRGLLPFRL